MFVAVVFRRSASRGNRRRPDKNRPIVRFSNSRFACFQELAQAEPDEMSGFREQP
jgi:hypothetical protein